MTIDEPPDMPNDVAAIFRSYPSKIGSMLVDVRRLIFSTAESTFGVGKLIETLKWGEPAYLTVESKSGSTIRLGSPASNRDRGAIYFNCKTTLVWNFRSLFSNKLDFAGSRAIILDPDISLPEEQLSVCLAMALTYHRSKQKTVFV